MSTLPERVESAESDAGRQGRALRRRDGSDERANTATSGGDVTENDAAFARESAIDDAVEMTFPASDPPAWMPSGVPRPVADAADGIGGLGKEPAPSPLVSGAV